MLKIYIQVFGTIALTAIILVNYNIFYRTPLKDGIEEQRGQVRVIEQELAVMQSVLDFEPAMPLVERAVDADFDYIRLDLPGTYSVPDRIKRIYDLVLACDLQYRGIPAQAVLHAQPNAKVGDFIPDVKDRQALQQSIKVFTTAMEPFRDPREALAFSQRENPIDRVEFYLSMAQGWNLGRGGLSGGLERHRYTLNLTGTYPNIKRFLWMVQHDKPLMQATAVRISPGPGVGPTRPFNLAVTIVAYVDRHDFYSGFNEDPTKLFGDAP